jgi:hypothetical protein
MEMQLVLSMILLKNCPLGVKLQSLTIIQENCVVYIFRWLREAANTDLIVFGFTQP